MKTLRITAASWAAIEAHAVGCYPYEACGFVIECDGREEVVCVTNVQNECRATNPSLRDARTAYTMGKEAAPIIVGHEHEELAIQAIFHSHPDHDAYFSPEDHGKATICGKPSYPQAGQLVISVYEGRVKEAKAFAWDAAANKYGEVPLRVE